MAVLVGSKHLARIHGDNAPGRVTAAWLSLPDRDDNALADARHTLDTFDLEPVVEAESGAQRLVIAWPQSPSQARVNVVMEVGQGYGCRLLAGGKLRLRAVRWPRLLKYLSQGLDGQSFLAPTSTLDKGKRSLLNSATVVPPLVPWRVHFSAGTRPAMLFGRNLWPQRCEGGCVSSRSILPLVCSGRGTTAPVWLHQCASTLLIGPCRERAGRGWPKARWALQHSGQLSSSVWKAIMCDLRDVQMDGVRCPDDPNAVLPLLLWWAALDGDSWALWLWQRRGDLAVL